jgi:hypothetical protein
VYDQQIPRSGVVNLSVCAHIWIAAGMLAVSSCSEAHYYQAGRYSYSCYLGPQSGTDVIVDWSEEGKRADATIDGHSYSFRLTNDGPMTDTYKDGEAELSIDPELRFTAKSGAESSLCNPGSRAAGPETPGG